MTLVFDNNFIKTHPLYESYPSDLDTLCIKDYGKKYFNKLVNCIDLDQYEKSRTGQNDCTMDACAGMAKYQNNTTNDQRLLLIELRFDYKSPNNLDLGNMARKISHSKSLLSGQLIHPDYFFLFTDNVAQQAENYFKRKARERVEYRNWKSVSPSNLFNLIEFIENQPHTFLIPTNEISDNITQALMNGEDDLFKAYDYWNAIIESYTVKYNYSESNHIIDTILSVLESNINNYPHLTDDIELIRSSLVSSKR